MTTQQPVVSTELLNRVLNKRIASGRIVTSRMRTIVANVAAHHAAQSEA